MSHHAAAVLKAKGTPLEVVQRLTPTPGPDEVLIEIHAAALNPVDVRRRDLGLMVGTFPTVLGSDASGIVRALGSRVSNVAVGDRVTGLVTAFFSNSEPNYGALQQKALARGTNLARIPESMGFREATLLPIAMCTVTSGLRILGLSLDTPVASRDNQALLVHGASSNVGSVAVQVATLLGFRVYATSSPVHHELLKQLGAQRTFDYKEASLVEDIARAVAADGVQLDRCFLGNGSREVVFNVLERTRGGKVARIAHSPALLGDVPVPEGIEVAFITAPSEEAMRHECFKGGFAWLEDKLAKGDIVPSPSVTVVEGGLGGADAGLDRLAKGVSGTKLVVDVQG